MEDEQKVEELLDEGLSLFYREHYADSEKELLKALELDPDNSEVNYQLGSACHFQGRIEDANGYYKKAVKLTPDDPHYHFVLGKSYLTLNFYKEAALEFEKTIEIDNTYAHVHENLGEAYYFMSEYEKSANTLETMLNIDPLARNYLYLYLSLRRAGKDDEARELLETAIKNLKIGDPFLPVIRLFLGYIDANDLLAKSGTQINHCTLNYYCGMSFLLKGENDKARDFFQQCLDTKQHFIHEFRRAQYELMNMSA